MENKLSALGSSFSGAGSAGAAGSSAFGSSCAGAGAAVSCTGAAGSAAFGSVGTEKSLRMSCSMMRIVSSATEGAGALCAAAASISGSFVRKSSCVWHSWRLAPMNSVSFCCARRSFCSAAAVCCSSVAVWRAASARASLRISSFWVCASCTSFVASFCAVTSVVRMASSVERYSSIFSASTFSFAFRAAFSLYRAV